MPPRTRLLLACLVLASAEAEAAPTETLLDCEAFKAGWSAALAALEPGHPAPAYEAPARGRPGPQHVTNIADADARITCLEGKLNRIEIRQAAGDAAATAPPLLRRAAAALVAFDRDLQPAEASAMIGAMRAEAELRRESVSSWGPYEITYGAKGGRAEFVADHAEN